jgi:hypothetical protein
MPEAIQTYNKGMKRDGLKAAPYSVRSVNENRHEKSMGILYVMAYSCSRNYGRPVY